MNNQEFAKLANELYGDEDVGWFKATVPLGHDAVMFHTGIGVYGGQLISGWSIDLAATPETLIDAKVEHNWCTVIDQLRQYADYLEGKYCG